MDAPITVRWADHHISHGDYSLDTIKQLAKPYHGVYTGHLVLETRSVIVLCSNVWDDGMVSDPMIIMKKCIVWRSDRATKPSSKKP